MSLLVFFKYYIQISKSNIFSTINEESDISSLGVDHATIFFYNSFLVRKWQAPFSAILITWLPIIWQKTAHSWEASLCFCVLFQVPQAY